MKLDPPPRHDEEYQKLLKRLDADDQWVDHTFGRSADKNPDSSGRAYFVPGVLLFVGSCLLLLASWRAGLVLSYPDRLWQINVPAMLGLVAMLVGFMGIFWVNWKEK